MTMGYQKRKIVVTGGSGFVGSHVVDVLLAQGHEPVIIDDLSSGVDFTPANVEVHRVTIGKESVADLVEKADAVIHCAAYADLRQNWSKAEERDRLVQNNIIATIALLEQVPPVPFVFVSTASVYGANTKPEAVVEGDATPGTIQSPYAASKLACEAFVAAYGHARGTRWNVARLVNVVGERTSHGVIGDFVRMAREKDHIHAADDGTQRKSWVHVLDVAEALVHMATYNTMPSGIYSVTSMERISWWNIIDEMRWPYQKVTYERKRIGAIGDPYDLNVDGGKLDGQGIICDRRPVIGIRDALRGLGWE